MTSYDISKNDVDKSVPKNEGICISLAWVFNIIKCSTLEEMDAGVGFMM